MTGLLLTIFILSLAMVLHTYVVYPFVMIWVYNKKKIIPALRLGKEQKPVSVVIAAFNEEKVIIQKINSVLNSNYPRHLISIYVGSDASSDKTDDLVKELAQTQPNLHLIRFEDRAGKTNVLNQLHGLVKDELLILTDANVLFTPDTIGYLMSGFEDEKVGLVAANIIKTSQKNEGISFQEKKYLSLENQIKSAESKAWGVMMGAEGGCYAIRKSLFVKIPERFIVDDFYITLQVIAKGKQTLFCEEAICYEDVAGDAAGEYRRKVRISSGNFQNLYFFRKQLFPFWTGVAFSFWSHKVLRWFTPFLLIIMCVCSILLGANHPTFGLLAILQLLLMCLPLLNLYFKFKNEGLRFLSHFYLMNFALLSGFFRYSRGIQSSIWQPIKRNV